MESKSTLFDYVNILFFLILSVVMIVPFLNVLTLSLEPEFIAAQTGVIHLFPREFTLDAYIAIWKLASIKTAFFNSVFVAGVGSVLGVIITGMLAYGLSFREAMGNRVFSYMILISMMFNAGIMPKYILVKNLGLINSLWSLIIPSLVQAFELLLMKVFFESLPKELSESAMIDGASEIGIFFKIILPLSTPILATVVLFYAVEHWNAFFEPVMYLTGNKSKTLQVVLREIIIQNSGEGSDSGNLQLGRNLQMATTIYAITPILLVYPFLQKHFTKGVLLGAVKG